MDNPENKNWQRRLEEIEEQLNQIPNSAPFHQTQPLEQENQTDKDRQIENFIVSIKQWFENLPQLGKMLAGGVGVLFALSLLNSFLHIISSILSIVFLAAGVYFIYKIIEKNKTQD
jgi:hypothetical protein